MYQITKLEHTHANILQTIFPYLALVQLDYKSLNQDVEQCPIVTHSTKYISSKTKPPTYHPGVILVLHKKS